MVISGHFGSRSHMASLARTSKSNDFQMCRIQCAFNLTMYIAGKNKIKNQHPH